jgi:hypothetical protein
MGRTNSHQKGSAMTRTHVRTLLAVGLTGLLIGGTVTAIDAKPLEHVRFFESESEVVDDFCGDLTVRSEYHDRGVIQARQTGPDRLPRYTVNHHGGATTTNLATGKAFTITWNYVEQEVRVRDNGDGTLTVLFQIPGPEVFYGPDGQRVFVNGGTMRIELIVDLAGTPDDTSDDVIIGEEFLSGHGGKPQPPFDFCESFRTLTG